MISTNTLSQNSIAYLSFTAIVGTYLLLLIFFPVAYIWAVYEDLVGEWAQWYSFLIAGYLSIRISLASQQFRPFFILLSIACFYVVMEEISWGQRLLDYSSPDFFKQHNLQNEANLHNLLVGPDDTVLRSAIEYILSLSLFSYGLVYPVLLKKQFRLAAFVHRWIPAPPLCLWPFFVTAALLELSPFYMLEQELAELLVGYALVIMTLFYYYKIERNDLVKPKKWSMAVLSVSVSIVLLSFVTTFTVYSIPHMKEQTIDRIHYGYGKFSSRYERYYAWGAIAQLKERILETTPRNVDLIREIASLYKQSNNRQQMQRLSKKALAIDLPRFQRYPEWVSVNLSLAKTYEITENTSEIKRHLDYALTGARKKVNKSPDSANSVYWLGKTYVQRKQFKLASLQFKRALELNPDSSKYRKAYDNSLENIPSE